MFHHISRQSYKSFIEMGISQKLQATADTSQEAWDFIHYNRRYISFFNYISFHIWRPIMIDPAGVSVSDGCALDDDQLIINTHFFTDFYPDCSQPRVLHQPVLIMSRGPSALLP